MPHEIEQQQLGCLTIAAIQRNHPKPFAGLRFEIVPY
jgi:hypothetical protein